MSRVTLKSDGGILLGDTVSCDGFAWQRPVRVQTHIHADHMVGFDTSKANQTLLMSTETRDLLFAIFNADLPYRTNVIALPFRRKYNTDSETIELLPSNHMLGGAQVSVTCLDGFRVGYSSDFFWPIDDVIQVDELLVDATYGNPLGIRRYDQQRVDELLISVAAGYLRQGRSTAIIGFNGRLQYVMHLLKEMSAYPVICSAKSFPLVDVYRQHGYPTPSVLNASSTEALDLLRRKEPCLAFVTLHERRHLPWVDRFAKISLSAYMTNASQPLVMYDNGDCCIALTDHADFLGTVEYVRATGAKAVWTDPRTGDADALAIALTERLGIVARPAVAQLSRAWG